VTDISWLGPPIDVRPLFAGQQAAFIDLLRGLGGAEWTRPTTCPGWNVKDIATHVLGDHLGRLSMLRDDFQALHPRSDEPFPAFIDRINDEWIIASRRLSPRLLVDLLSSVGDEVVEFWQTVDLEASGGPVTWAGPEPAPVWLDAARDFTEYWTHHQQICDATGRPGLSDPAFVGPVIDTFLRALPHTLHEVTAPERTTVEVTVTGPGGGAWTCTRTRDGWALDHGPTPKPSARLELDTDTTWRLCTRGITPEQAAEHASVEGDHQLATTALQIVSIIWSPPAREQTACPART
jgi:uncharacterized protein (TIGR03083 family)